MSNDAHSFWVNSIALEKANITKDTPNPPGGVIERDPNTGEPTGTLRETANELITQILPEYTLDERKKALIGYQEMAAKAGVTMVHDAMLDIPSISALRTMEKEDLLKMRFRGAVTMEPGKWREQLETLLKECQENNTSFLQILTAKFFVDGVVEGGTAWLLEPYAHKPDYYGEPIWDTSELNEAILEIDKLGLQIHIHICGDAAARVSLDALEIAQQANGKRDSRHLITHLQLVTPEDILRFKILDVIGVPQPFWHKKDDYYRELQLPYLGKERADKEYPMQSFLDAGVILASASDFPVSVPFDPLIGIQTGVTRTDLQGTPGKVLWPEEKPSLEDLVKSFTYNGAYANFLETELGSLEAGKKADLIIIDQNIFDLNPTQIAQAEVLMTMVNGEEIYRSPEFN
jgi:predicted amidohydrolase YtcJ